MTRKLIRDLGAALCLVLAVSSYHLIAASRLNFGPEHSLGQANKNPAAPFLRFAPDGRLYAIWTEADDRQAPAKNAAHQHEAAMRRMMSPMRVAVLASSSD